MTIEQSVVEKLRALPPERQKEVLDFVEFLEARAPAAKPHRSLHGLWADLGIDLKEEDITEARRELWGSFPRERF